MSSGIAGAEVVDGHIGQAGNSQQHFIRRLGPTDLVLVISRRAYVESCGHAPLGIAEAFSQCFEPYREVTTDDRTGVGNVGRLHMTYKTAHSLSPKGNDGPPPSVTGFGFITGRFGQLV